MLSREKLFLEAQKQHISYTYLMDSHFLWNVIKEKIQLISSRRVLNSQTNEKISKPKSQEDEN